jgi:hypothetical protein
MKPAKSWLRGSVVTGDKKATEGMTSFKVYPLYYGTITIISASERQKLQVILKVKY